MKAVVAAFNQEKALVGAFSVITNLRMGLFEALTKTSVYRDGRAFNINEPKLQFQLDDSSAAETVLTLQLWRHLATEQLDLDVQPHYVRWALVLQIVQLYFRIHSGSLLMTKSSS